MENETQNITMDEVMESFGDNNNRIDPGDIIKGKVVSVKEDELVVNIGFYADGVLAKNEFEDGVEDLRTAVKEGEEISVMVVKVDDGEGNVILSKKRADQIVAWDELKEVHDNDKVITLPVNNVVKGGVTVSYKGVRGFIPASQLSVDFVKDLKPYVGVDLAVKLIEFDKEARKVIFSHRVIEEVERKRQREEMLSKIEKGQRYNGKVVRLQRFGAFVDIGGVQGLIHNNDLSWTRIKHPSEVVKEGDVVDVYVMDFDREKGKIGLGLKDVNDNPWNKIAETLKVGHVVEGKITRLAAFGAFVALEAGIEGLVHISEIDEKRINKPEDVLEKGQEVKVKVLNIDTENNKLSLSIKAAKEEAARASIPSEYKEEQDLGTTLGDVFNIKLD